MIKETELALGVIVDVGIYEDGYEPCHIIGEVKGIRRDMFNPDVLEVLIAGADNWYSTGGGNIVELADV